MFGKIGEWFASKTSKERKAREIAPEAGTPTTGAETAAERASRLAPYYAELGVPAGSDLRTARVAWKAGLKACHPDLISEDYDRKTRATEKVRRLNEAYRALENELF